MMQENASEVHLVVNTNNHDQGIVNARLLGDMLGEGSSAAKDAVYVTPFYSGCHVMSPDWLRQDAASLPA